MSEVSTTIKQPPYPWPDALEDIETMGDDAAIHKKFRLLSSLQIPLGKTEEAVKARMSLLRSLLDFDEIVMGTSKHKLERNAMKVDYQYALKIPHFQQVVTNFRFMESLQKRNFFDNLWQCMFNDKELENDKPAELFCHYLAKFHNDSFLKVAPRALKIGENVETIEQGITMYDGGSIDNVNHVAWNKHYGRLMEFQKENGHCLVSVNDDSALCHWITNQRSNRRHGEPALTPKRIQLLDDIGFSWTGKKLYDRINDPKFHKTLAAKLFFNPDLLDAKDAMAMSGFIVVKAKGTAAAAKTTAASAAAASTTGTADTEVMTPKRIGIHDAVAKFYTKEYSYTKKVREILMKLSQMLVDPKANKNDILLNVFGASETLTRLLKDGKLVPRHENDRPWLQSTTDGNNSSSNTGSTITNINNSREENGTKTSSSTRDEMMVAATMVAAAAAAAKDSSKDMSSTVGVVRNDTSSGKKRKSPPPPSEPTEPDRVTI